MSIIELILFYALLHLPQAEKPVVLLPTSEVLHLAEMAARDEGFEVKDGKRFFFDLATTAEGKELVPGYVSMGFYGNGHPIHIYSINKKTAQVVDVGHCEVFVFKDLEAYARNVQSEAGVQPRSIQQLAEEVGCSSLSVIDKRTANTSN